MSIKLTGTFDTRREAEMAVERLVQEYEIDRKAIGITPEGAANSAGDEPGGSDMAGLRPTSSKSEDAALAGRIVVAVEVAGDEAARKVRAAIAEFGGGS